MSLRTELHTRISDVAPTRWDALTGSNDPFVEHAFLSALEQSRSVGPGTGWLPVHVTVWDGDTLVGALPLYEKDDSWGEYIFDFAWARAAMSAGIPYYPKLVSMVPFTPATGRRLLVCRDADYDQVTRALLEAARSAAEERGASGLHLLFLAEAERTRAIELGLRPRLSTQFHWDNEGYRTFDDYLARFRSQKRKQVRKERRRVAEAGLQVQVLRGTDLDETHWRALELFYRQNCLRHGSYPYLTPAFFDAVRRTHAHRLVAVLACRDGEPVAASINFEKGAHLYGRYWGCAEEHEFLHFELCYYRLIERAIERGLAHFEAGAQGLHKLKRGLMPARVHSAHWVADPRLKRAIDEYLPAEAGQVEAEMAMLAEHGPFKRP